MNQLRREYEARIIPDLEHTLMIVKECDNKKDQLGRLVEDWEWYIQNSEYILQAQESLEFE